MEKELQQYFMQRWAHFKESVDSHPYAQWVTVLDPRTADACKSLHGKAWRVDGKKLSDLVYLHIDQNHNFCRCRLRPITIAEIASKNIVAMD